jgi:hypothetical protein
MYWGSTPYNGGPDGTVGRLIASSAAIVSISDNMKGAVGRVVDLRNGSAPVQKDPRYCIGVEGATEFLRFHSQAVYGELRRAESVRIEYQGGQLVVAV